MPTGSTVYFTDLDLRPVGDPVRWTAIDAVARFNEPGSCSVTCPASPDVAEQLATPGRRAVLVHNGAVFMAGPVERPHGPYQWEAGGGEFAEPGLLSFHFTDDLARVVGAVTYPDPTLPPTTPPAAARYEDTALAGAIMTDLVNLNVGPGALAARQIPGLVIGDGALLGTSVTWGTRFQPLGDDLRALAIAGGGLGFRTTADTSQITFEAYETLDLSASVRFTRGLGNLRAVTYESEAPRVTTVIVGGADEGIARTIVERNNTAAESAWWRIEQFADQRQAETTAELNQAGDEALAEGGESARLATVTVDTPTQRYGEHYRLGDRVSTEPLPGVEVVDLVRSAHLQITPQRGALLTAMVGSQSMARDPEWLRQSRRLAQRLAQLETI